MYVIISHPSHINTWFQIGLWPIHVNDLDWTNSWSLNFKMVSQKLKKQYPTLHTISRIYVGLIRGTILICNNSLSLSLSLLYELRAIVHQWLVTMTTAFLNLSLVENCMANYTKSCLTMILPHGVFRTWFRLRWRGAPVKNCRGIKHVIGYTTGPSPTGAYTTAKTPPMENVKHGWKNDVVANTTTFIAREFSGGQVRWATSNPWTKNLTSKESSTWGICFNVSPPHLVPLTNCCLK